MHKLKMFSAIVAACGVVGLLTACPRTVDTVDGVCGANILSTPFLDATALTSNLSQMQPMGNIYGAHLMPTANIYLDLVRTTPGDHSTHSVSTNILAPGHVRVVAVAPHMDSDLPGASVNAFRVTFKICQNTYMYVDHLNTLNSHINAQSWVDLTGGPVLSLNDLIGTTTSTHAIDIGAFDIGSLAPFISPNFYLPSYTADFQKVSYPALPYMKCPLDYLTPSAQDALLATNPRTASPRCGEFAQDIPGTAAGNWFSVNIGALPKATGILPEEPLALSLTHDSVNPNIPGFSFGTDVPVTNADGTALAMTSPIPNLTKYYFAPAASNLQNDNLENPLFRSIEPSDKIYCFNNLKADPWSTTTIPSRIVLLQLQTVQARTTLRVQVRERESCPDVAARNLNGPLVGEYFRD